ncbi:MAG: zinc-binding dehydrogenase [Oscillospiraceae bacterium]|nr:zinc-binding dehydrogenase [Oscillospiraceae bacterium]MBQ7435753.1 zinc-binding dehydrogenase [Oscillospiraceae bacterium]
MKAVVLEKVTPIEQIKLTEVPVPQVKPGWVLVKVRAFGLNHSEKVLRTLEIEESYIKKPVIPGIECVGEVADPGDTRFIKGQKVCALMGGMGRSFDGSYAEFALLPEHHVFAVESELPWEQLGAVPETYFTAWGSLFECLQLKHEDTLLVRGATCALGYAVIQLAKALGCRVIGTTHRESKFSLLEEAGADEVVLDEGVINGKVSGVTKALDLIGPRNLRDTLTAVDKGAIVCNTGILGGVFELNAFDPIKEIPNGVYLTGFFSNYPTQEIMDEIFAFLNAHDLQPRVGQIFDLAHIRDAVAAQDSRKINGKVVVTV